MPDTVTLGGRAGGREASAAALVDNNPLVLDLGIEALTAGLSRSRSGRIGLRNTPGFLLDVEALTVRLAREARLRSLNDYRAYFGLRQHRGFADLYGAATFSATGLEVLAATSSLRQVVARNVAQPERVHVSFRC